MAGQKTNYVVACEVLEGLWGNGPERRERLEKAGYSYSAIQSLVNCLIEERNREASKNNFDRFMMVEVDLDKYEGINLKIKGKGAV